MSDIKPLPAWEFLNKAKPAETTETPVENNADAEAARVPSLFTRLRSVFLGEEKKNAALDAQGEAYRPNSIEKFFCKDMGIQLTCSEEFLKEEGLAYAHGIRTLFETTSGICKKMDEAWRMELGSLNYWYEHTKAVWTGIPSPYVRPPAAEKP